MQNKSEELEENKIKCPFYDELDAVLGHRPASAPPLVLDVSAGGISVEPTEERDDDRRNGRFILVIFKGITQPLSPPLLVPDFQMKHHSLRVRRNMFTVSNMYVFLFCFQMKNHNMMLMCPLQKD